MPDPTFILRPSSARTPRRGVALLLVLVTMGTATTLTLGWLASQDNAVPVSRNVTRTAQARAVASSGLELAIAIMQTNTPWRTTHDQGFLLSSHQIGQGSVDVEILDVATDLPPVEGADTIRVLVTARVENLVQQVEAIASVTNVGAADSDDLSGFAVWVHSGMRLQGKSTVGRWEAAPMTSLGRRVFIGTDAMSPRSIDIGPRVTAVDWTLVHDETASHSLLRNETDMRIRSRPAIDVFGPKATAQFLPATTGNADGEGWFNPRHDDWEEHPSTLRLGSGTTVDLPESSNIVLDSFELDSGTTLRVTGETTMTIRDSFVIENASITLAPGATLNLVCGGEVTLRDAYLGDDGGNEIDHGESPRWYDASRFHITSAGNASDAPPWLISGSSLVKAVIEAPDAQLEIRDESKLAGRLAVDFLRTRHNAMVLYDHGLDSGTSATKLAAENEGIRGRINRKLAQRFKQWAEELGFLDTSESDQESGASTSRYGLAADGAWSNNPSDREIPVDVQLLIHGGDTGHWEESIKLLQAEASQ